MVVVMMTQHCPNTVFNIKKKKNKKISEQLAGNVTHKS